MDNNNKNACDYVSIVNYGLQRLELHMALGNCLGNQLIVNTTHVCEKPNTFHLMTEIAHAF